MVVIPLQIVSIFDEEGDVCLKGAIVVGRILHLEDDDLRWLMR
jgi:hypothetical protein